MEDKITSLNVQGEIESRYAYIGVFLSAVAFQIANQILVITGPPKSVETEEWKFRNLFISWVHALIVGVWDIMCFVLHPELMSDPVTSFNTFSFSMIAVSTGYFFYDFVDICRNNTIKSQWEVLLHHIAVSSMFFYNLVTCQCIGYNMIALTAEINSIFLHSRKLLQLQQVDFNSMLYRVNAWINLITFVVCRFGGMLAIFAGMAIWYNRVSVIYFVSLTFSMVVMFPVNTVLFQRLLKNDVYRFRRNAYHNKYRQQPSSEKKPMINGVGSSNNNMSKMGENGHIGHHHHNGLSNGVVRPVGNYKEKEM